MSDQRKFLDPKLADMWGKIYPELMASVRQSLVDEHMVREAAIEGWPKILIGLRAGEKPDQRLVDAYNMSRHRQKWIRAREIKWLEQGELLEVEYDEKKRRLLHVKDPITPKQHEAYMFAHFWQDQFDEEQTELDWSMSQLVQYREHPIVASILGRYKTETGGTTPEVKGIEKEYLEELTSPLIIDAETMPIWDKQKLEEEKKPELPEQRRLPLQEAPKEATATKKPDPKKKAKPIPFRKHEPTKKVK